MGDDLKAVPIVGNEYHFFDDGKIKPSRHSIATILRLVSPDEAKNIFVDSMALGHVSLWEIWKDEVEQCDWLYEKTTDWFVEASDKDYDEHNLWFVRTQDGGWFSMDVENGWQSGRLDIDGSLYEMIKDLYNK